MIEELAAFDKQVVDLAHVMLHTLVQAIDEATGEEKLRLIVEYTPAIRELQKAMRSALRGAREPKRRPARWPARPSQLQGMEHKGE